MINLQERFWNNDWFVAIVVGISLIIIAQTNLLQPLEQGIYDWSLQHINRQPSNQVAVIAIDDNSLAQLGHSVWSRTHQAKVIDLISPYSKVIATTLNLSQKQKDIGYLYINELSQFYAHSKPLNELPEQMEKINHWLETLGKLRTRYPLELRELLEFYQTSGLPTRVNRELTTLEERLKTANLELDSDQRLINSFKQANNLVLGMTFTLSEENNKSVPNLPDYMTKYGLRVISDRFDNRQEAPLSIISSKALPPLVEFTDQAKGVGAVVLENINPRHFPLVINYGDYYFPTLPLLLLAKSRHLFDSDVEARLGLGVRLGAVRINTDAALQIQPFFYRNGVPVDSFVDVLQGRINPEKYQGKLVLLGVTARYHTALQDTPIGTMPAILVSAQVLMSLINQDLFIMPFWARAVQVLLFSLAMLYLIGVLPHLKKSGLLWLISLTWLTVIGGLYVNLLEHGFSIPLLEIGLLLPCGHIALLVKRGLIAYQDAFRLHPDAVESNRLLGLAFQGQGHLDMAFEKFRLCPPDEAIKGLLYNLALDYEMKRQFRGAAAVYRYLLGHDVGFRDVGQRLERLRRLRRPLLRFGATGSLNDWLLDDTLEKPLLGRYQVERQIGKGAMGIVYLGKDPKLDRLVAIKTLALSQEFEEDVLEEVTTRFFGEAAAAGRLTHPYIVSIYDAGEEYDVAYITMEFFKGGNLVPYTKRDNLLSVITVIDIVQKVAEALEYAHNQGVVHRDIKPANIMYNPATGKIKITDFGIARLTDSNKTKTGVIFGTPSYMSPEQLAGKQLDGRTDLFSLGVTLFQLLTGILPFEGDSMAALMFKIANEPHPDILSLRPELPSCLKQVVDTALQKEARHRYQNGAQFVQALTDCCDKAGFTQAHYDKCSNFGVG